MRSRIIIVCSIALVLVIAGTLAAQEDRHFLESKAFDDRQRPGVVFKHLFHYEMIDCMDCHHDYDDGENVWDMYSGKNYCSDCHTVQGEGKVMGLMDAFHESCVGCHQKTLDQGQSTGPIMCGECHVRP